MRFNSVATTSSKSVPVLQADIRRVLDRIGIQYRMNKGGFECVHVPSIDLSSVLSPQEVNHGATNQQPSQHSVSTSGPDAHHGDPWSLEGLDSSSGSFAQHAAEKRHGAAGESEEAAFFLWTWRHEHADIPVGCKSALSGGPTANGSGHLPPSQSHTGDDDFDAWAFGASGGTGSDLLVRFEISIVKVSSDVGFAV